MRRVAMPSMPATTLLVIVLVLAFALPSCSAQKHPLDDRAAVDFAAALRLEAAHAHCPLCTKASALKEEYVVVPRLVRFTAFSSVSQNCSATLRLKRAESAFATDVVAAAVVNGVRETRLLDGQADGDVVEWWLPVTLRAGVNTVGFYFNAPARVSCLEIGSAQAVNVADTGPRPGTLSLWQFTTANATSATFVEYEAEDEAVARCVGPTAHIIGPNFTAYSDIPHLATEASGRKVCSLESTGDTLEVTLKQPANALELRYSIPDSPGGGGQAASISVTATDADGNALPMRVLDILHPTQNASSVHSVSASEALHLSMTSAFSWFYGNYPFTNNPADGNPHHFFDEVRAIWNDTLDAGSVVRFSFEDLHAPHPVAEGNLLIEPNLKRTAGPDHGNSCPSVPSTARHDCGFDGITKAQCLARSCCFVPVTPNPTHIPYCFHPLSPSPAPAPINASVPVTLDLVDFYLAPQPLTPPASGTYVNVIDFGADPSGSSDSLGAFGAAIAAAAAARFLDETNQTERLSSANNATIVWVPPGTFLLSDHVVVEDGLTLQGAGPFHTVLKGMPQEESSTKSIGVYGKRASQHPGGTQGISLLDFLIEGRVLNRCDSCDTSGIGGSLGAGSLVQNVWVRHTKCGLWLDGPFADLHVVGVDVRNTNADGINLHGGVEWVTLEHSRFRNTGDDAIALWSDRNSGGADTNNLIQHNTIQLPNLANGIAVYGGSNNTIHNNSIADTITSGGGIHIGNRFSSVPVDGINRITNNTLTRTGCLDSNWHFGVGALWFFSLEESLDGRVQVEGLLIIDSPQEAIHFMTTNASNTISNVEFHDCRVENVGTFVIQIQSGGSASFENVVASGMSYFGQYNCEPDGTFQVNVSGGGNSGWNSTHCGFPPMP